MMKERKTIVFKNGTNIEVIDINNINCGRTGQIVSAIISTGLQCYEVLLDGDSRPIVLACTQIRVTPPVAPSLAGRKFKIGEEVQINGSNLPKGSVYIGKSAKVMGYSGSDVMLQVSPDTYTTYWQESSLNLVSPQMQLAARFVSYGQQNALTGVTSAVRSGSLFGVDIGFEPTPVASQGCTSHKWRFYQGLNERFDWCENPGCKAKRDTDRRA